MGTVLLVTADVSTRTRVGKDRFSRHVDSCPVESRYVGVRDVESREDDAHEVQANDAMLSGLGPASVYVVDCIADSRPDVAWRSVRVPILRHDGVDSISPWSLSGYFHWWVDEEVFPDRRIDLMRQFDGVLEYLAVPFQ